GSPVLAIPIGIYPSDTNVEKDPKNGLVTVAPGMPFSMYIYGRRYDYDRVLELAKAVEELTQVRQSLRPYKVPTVDL
ncbi:hypothetical protein M011DRAFT_378458, partial [Sporormia fimetaria CBS 119925]